MPSSSLRTLSTSFRYSEEFARTFLSDILRLTGMKQELADSQNDEELLDIAPLRTVTVPKIAPSFTTCAARRDYVLSVVAGFSFGSRDELSVWPCGPGTRPPSVSLTQLLATDHQGRHQRRSSLRQGARNRWETAEFR